MLDLQIDSAASEPVVVKERVRHPVSGETLHIDLLRVDLDVSIQAPVLVELTDIDESDVKVGGVLEHSIQTITVEAKPGDVPDVIYHSIAGLEIGGNVSLGELKAPEGVTIIGDPDQVLAVIRTSRSMMAAEDEIELEPEVVGEGEEGEGEEGASEAEAEGDAAEASGGE